MDGQDVTTRVDPVALTLALWLGLVVGVAGVPRISEQAAARAARDEAAGRPSLVSTVDDVPWATARALAFGG